MVMRALYPTAGGVHLDGRSVLDDFGAAATSLGVVSQQNTLWDKLSCAEHLQLFAQLRGAPRAAAKTLTRDTLEQMELTPYAHRLAVQVERASVTIAWKLV